MSTSFKEWQKANLSAEQQQECNALCEVEAQRMDQLGATPDESGNAVFPSVEAQTEFVNGRSAGFIQYWSQFQASN